MFGSKTKTVVDSATYGLNGVYDKNKTYQKTLNVNSVFNRDKLQFTELVAEGHLNGPFRNISSFYNWSERVDYKKKTNQTDPQISSNTIINEEILREFLKFGSKNVSITIDYLNVGPYDFFYHVSDYLLKNHPSKYEMEWEASLDATNKVYIINFPSTGEVIKIPLKNTSTNDYIQVIYSIVSFPESVPSSTEYHTITDEFPNLHGYVMEEDVEEVTYTLTELLYEYVYEEQEEQEEEEKEEIERKEILVDSATITETREVRTLEGYKISIYPEDKNVKQTDTSVVREFYTKEIVREELENGYILKEVLIKKYSNSYYTSYSSYSINEGRKVYEYLKNSGNSELDKLFPSKKRLSDIFPIMPIRVNSRNISSSYYSEIRKLNETGYKKLTASSYSELINNINKNESINDIDYAQIRIGVPLNTKDPLGKDYIFTFFDEHYKNNPVSYSKSYQHRLMDAINAMVAEAGNLAAIYSGPVYGTFFPLPPTYGIDLVIDGFAPGVGSRHIQQHRIQQFSGTMKFNYNLTWAEVFRRSGSGKLPGYNVGDIKVVENKSIMQVTAKVSMANNAPIMGLVWNHQTQRLENQIIGYWYNYVVWTNADREVSILTLRKQVTETLWVEYEIAGLEIHNVIANGVSTYEHSHHTFNKKEGECEIIIPITYSYFKSLSLKHRNQLALRVMNITFNAYETKKVKWYQSGIFRIVLTIAITVSIAMFNPTGIGLAGGIFGTNAAVGAAIGLSGLAGAIVGATINALAAMVITSFINKAASKIFGEALGGLIGQIASMAISQGFTLGNDSFSFGSLFEGLLKTDNLLSITSAVGKGYLQHVQKKKMGGLISIQNEIKGINERIEEINKKMLNDFEGINIINPLILADPFEGFIEGETSDEFIKRTLLLGSDVVEITYNLISEYVEINTSLGNK